MISGKTAAVCAFLAAAGGIARAGERHYRLPAVDLKAPIIWGAECVLPDGTGLAFGGEEQAAEDGCARTRILENGIWRSIADDLVRRNPRRKLRDEAIARRDRLKAEIARLRREFLEGLAPEGTERRIASLFDEMIRIEKEAEALDAEPPPRALSPIAYEPRSGLFVIFGGDHLDFLMNDIWVFDPAKRVWEQRRTEKAPPPRANHSLAAKGDGTVVLSGGYTYTSSTDYCGGQYKDIGDGPWTYDVAQNEWSGEGTACPSDARVYRTGPFHPSYYLEGPTPDPKAFEARIRAMPINTWVLTKPPRRLALNRDWGTAVLDPDLDAILYWSGGHSAHGGSDVPHFHLSTNRWELAYPVEFPLGQLYSNTSYPGGVNFNRRPWPTGHTYQSYAYDPISKTMLFTGHERYTYVYDPEIAEWTGRFEKPAGMVYDSCFYTLTLCATPEGVYCWTRDGKIFRFDASGSRWVEVPLKGKLPGASVDFSTLVHDAKRDRLLFIRTDYGGTFDGQVHALDLSTFEASALSPKNMEAAKAAGRFGIDRACYDPRNDLFLLATLLPPGPDGLRRTPAYDCAGNRWVSLRIAYEERKDRKTPYVPMGHSCGIVYDAKRGLVWGVDAASDVYVLRLDAGAADMQEIR
ncbi:MAG: hypothetical protein JXP34_21980 [Planctomycetes bacterium]|nr:hypothetical protein [Planctomycetota bacterium]